nr:MAG TPA: hypothetical protein [Caudoviricetes sp.]
MSNRVHHPARFIPIPHRLRSLTSAPASGLRF